MKFADSVHGLVRRWYVLLPSLLLVATIAVGAWFAVPPGYSRSATQLLIPGESSIPEGQNPYLYLGGLSPAADVLVRAIGSENVLNDVVDGHPGTEIEIFTAGNGSPIIIIEVTASSNTAAEQVLTTLIDRTATVLDEIQDVENIPDPTRMSVVPVTVDEQSMEQSRSRLLAAFGVGLLGTVIALLVTSLVDGSSRRREDSAYVEASERNDVDAEHGLPGVDGARDTARTADTGPGPTAQPAQSPAGQARAEYLPAEPRSRVRW